MNRYPALFRPFSAAFSLLFLLTAMRPDRKEIATTVAQDPASYKICLVCGSLVDRHADTCPDCMAYRFDEELEHILNRAIDLGARPWQTITHLDKQD